MPPTGFEFRRDPYWGKRHLQGSGSVDPIIADLQGLQVSHVSIVVTSEGLVAEPDGKLWIVAGDILVPATNPNAWRRAQTLADVTAAVAVAGAGHKVAISQRTMDMTGIPASEYKMSAAYWELRFYDRNVRSVVDESMLGLEDEVIDAIWPFGLKAASRGI